MKQKKSNKTELYCLALILGSIAVVLLNLSLLFWTIDKLQIILKHFDQDRSQSSLHLIGSLIFGGHTTLTSISSTENSQLSFRSNPGIIVGDVSSVKSENSIESFEPNRIEITENAFLMTANELRIRSTDDRLILLAHSKNLKILTDKLEIVRGDQNDNFEKLISMLNQSIQIINLSGERLNFHSHTNHIRLLGTLGLSLASKNSSLFESEQRLLLQSHSDAIHLSAKNIKIDKDIKLISASSKGQTYRSVSHLCLCAQSGRLFMAPVDDQSEKYTRLSHSPNISDNSPILINSSCDRLASMYCLPSNHLLRKKMI